MIYSGPAKIKYWKLHDLHKAEVKNIYIPYEDMTKFLKILVAPKTQFKSVFSSLGG